MRIVGGKYRGKKLIVPGDNRVRPTSERTREALFNILAHQNDYRTEHGPMPTDARVLDIFAGTGALGIEALSRGADHVTFIDNNRDSLDLIKHNIQQIKVQEQADILNRDGAHPGHTAKTYDLVLMDAPYRLALTEPCLQALSDNNWITEQSVIVVELAAKEKIEVPEAYKILDDRKYGAARLLFLRLS
jgi:16S rRNA (guanine966-N2)-methyltransferase